MNSIQQAITQAIDVYAGNIATKYDLDKQELIDMWNQLDAKKQSASPASLIKPVVPPPKPTSKIVDTEKSTGCPYLFTKGAREGELCNNKPTKGETYCCRHKKYEGTDPKVKKVLPTAKKTMSEAVKPSVKQPVGKKPVNIILKKHKVLDQYMDTETGFLFRSKDDRVVVGRAVDDKCVPLSEKDIDEVKSRGFKYEMVKEKCEEVEEEELKDVEEELEDEDEEKIVKPKEVKKPSPKTSKPIKASDVKSVKKSISSAINKTSEQAESVEEILGMLQKKPSSGIQKKSTKDEEFASEAEDEEDDDASVGGDSFGNDLDEEDD